VSELSCCSLAHHASERELLQREAELSCCSANHALEKEVTQPASNMILKEAVSLPELVKRVQELEGHCEQALGALRDVVVNSMQSQQTPQAPGQPVKVLPHVCPILSQSPRTALTTCSTTSSHSSATRASHVPLPTSLIASLMSPGVEQKPSITAACRMSVASDAGDSTHSIEVLNEIG